MYMGRRSVTAVCAKMVAVRRDQTPHGARDVLEHLGIDKGLEREAELGEVVLEHLALRCVPDRAWEQSRLVTEFQRVDRLPQDLIDVNEIG